MRLEESSCVFDWKFHDDYSSKKEQTYHFMRLVLINQNKKLLVILSTKCTQTDLPYTRFRDRHRKKTYSMFKMGSILKTNSTSKLEVRVSFWTISAQKKIKNPEASSSQVLLHVVRFLVCTKSSKLGRGKCKKLVTGCALKFNFYGIWTTVFQKTHEIAVNGQLLFVFL